MKKLNKILIPAAAAIATVGVATPLVVSCNKEEVKITSITVDASQVKKNYFVWEKLNLEKLVVTAVYNNGVTEVVTDYATNPGAEHEFKPGETGEKTITVSYLGFQDSFKVNVADDEIATIAVTSEDDWTFSLGQTFHTTGLVVAATGKSGHLYENFTDFKTDPEVGTPLNTPGEVTVTVYVGDIGTTTIKTTYTVYVEDAVAGIEVTQGPTKDTYYDGQKLDLTGMKVKATYVSGDVDEDFKGYSTYPANGATLSCSSGSIEKTIEIYVNNFVTSTKVTVQADTIQSIAITKSPTKTTFYEGEVLDLTGMEVTATYTGKGPLPIEHYGTNPGDRQYVFTAADAAAGTKTIEVFVGSSYTTIDVNVKTSTVTKIEITKEPLTEYFVGEALMLDGMKVKATFADGGVAEDYRGYTSDPEAGTPFEATGTQTVTISANGHTDTFTVTVDNDAVTGVTLTSLPTKLEYVEGQTFDKTGLVATATLKSKNTENVTQYCDITINDEPADEFVFETAGTYTVTVKYVVTDTEVYTNTFEVGVLADEVVGIKATCSHRFAVNDTWDFQDTKVTLLYMSGKEGEQISVDECSSNPARGSQFTARGNITITIYYGDYSVDIKVVVR